MEGTDLNDRGKITSLRTSALYRIVKNRINAPPIIEALPVIFRLNSTPSLVVNGFRALLVLYDVTVQ